MPRPRGQSSSTPGRHSSLGNPSRVRAIVISFPIISACLVGLLYARSLRNAFVYDDLPQIVDNPAVHSVVAALGYFARVVPFSTDYLSSGGSFYRPLFWLSLSLDHAVWGDVPAGFHFTNILLHWLCGVLLWRLLRQLDLPPTLVVGAPLVWLTLPVHTEVVAWVSGRPFSLATASLLAGLMLLTRQTARPRRITHLLIGLAFLSALLSHEIGMLATPLAVLVLAYTDRRPPIGVSLLGALFLPPFAYLMMRTAASANIVVPVADSLRLVPLLLGRYGEWIMVPPPLSIDRSTDWSALSASVGMHVVGWIALAAVATITAVGWRRRIAWSLGLTWFGLCMLPFLNLVPLSQGMAERYAYLPSIGLVIALGAAIRAVGRRGSAVGTICALMLVAIVGWYGWRTVARVADWHDEWSLYETSLESTPGSHVLRYNLAVKLADASHFDQAERLYREAITLHDPYLAAKVNLANLLQRRGEYSEAQRLYQDVLATEPDRKEALLNLANLFQRIDDVYQAELNYNLALKVDPDYGEAKLNLGVLWQAMGKYSDARRAYQEVLSVDPGQPQAHLNLGVLMFQVNDIGAAIEHLQQAIRLQPRYPEACFNLGVAYEAAGDPDAARRAYSCALDLRPDYEQARINLARLQHQ